MDKDKPLEQSKLIRFGPRMAVWSPFIYRSPVSFRLDGKEQLYDVEAEIVFEEGRLICDRLTVARREGGPPVTTEGIRRIGIATLLHVAAEYNVMHITPTGDEAYKAMWPMLPMLSERAQHGGGPSEEDLWLVATVYQVAYATGEAPTKTVMNRLALPRSTASRWIRMARERGLLGPATPSKAGG
jgi:hypothetical protein